MRIFLVISTCCTIIFLGIGCSSPTAPASAPNPVTPDQTVNSNAPAPISFPSTFLPDTTPGGSPAAGTATADSLPKLKQQIIGNWDFYAFRKKGTNDPLQPAAPHARHRLTFTRDSITWIEGATKSTRGYAWAGTGRIKLLPVTEQVQGMRRQQTETRHFPETFLDLQIAADGSLVLAANRTDDVDNMQMYYRRAP